MFHWPKIELHLHLDGSLRVETVWELAKERKVQLPTGNPEKLAEYLQAPANCPSLVDYLQRFDLPLEILQDEESLERVAEELVEDLQQEKICYGEIRYAPNLHLDRGLKPKSVVEAVVQGVKRATAQLGLEIGIILCCMRHHSLEMNKNVVRLAGDYLGGGVVAVDLAGDEANFPAGLQREVFTFAQGAGIPYTIHAGEAPDPRSIWAALQLGATRIGHGVQAGKDPALLEHLKEKGIVLEMCPTSNVQTKAAASLAAHPIREYFSRGLKVTVNTDNRTVSNTTLTKEYELLQGQFGFTKEEFKEMNLAALEGAFASKGVKEKIRELIDFGGFE